LSIENAEPFTLYKIGSGYTASPVGSTGLTGYNPYRAHYDFNATHYYDFYNNKSYPLDNYNPSISINGSNINIEDTEEFTLHKPGKLTGLITGNGTTTEVAY
jgi:hypothetical protein